MKSPTTLVSGEFWYQELSIGNMIRTGSTEISIDLIDRFAAISGDWNAVQMDDQKAQALGFKKRVADGLWVLSVVDGLKFNSDDSLDGIASLSWNWKFEQLIYVGDHIRIKITVLKKREAPLKNMGIVRCQLEVFNQHGGQVQFGTNDLAFGL